MASTLLHVYYLPDLGELAPLLDIYEPILGAAPELAPVERPWLHATLLKIVPERGVVDQALVASRLRDCLLRHEPVSLTAGPAFVGASSVVLDLTPDTDWRRLRAAVATVVDDVLGVGAARINAAERPHITLAYGIGDADSGVLQSQLRRATDQRCHLTLTQLDLVDVTQDRIAHMYRWTPVSGLRLAARGGQR